MSLAVAHGPDEVDAAYAAVLTWQARLDAVAAGIGATRKKRVIAQVRGGVLG